MTAVATAVTPGQTFGVTYNSSVGVVHSGKPYNGAEEGPSLKQAALWTDPARARTVARYTEGNPLRSGCLLGPQFVAGKSALVDVDLGKGRVVLFGFRTQHRAQTWGTFKLLFNSIMLGGMNQKEAAGAVRPR